MYNMSEKSYEIKRHMDVILNVNYGFNNNYGVSYITPEQFNRIDNSISALRKLKAFDGHDANLCRSILKIQLTNYYKINEMISKEPRSIAQRFIGKKNIRKFIFDRDGNMCLCCGSIDNLTIDHIVPIHLGGVNRLYNLQTLCRSCNSRKSTNIEDYRR